MKKRYKALQNRSYHINLKGGAMATVTGWPSPELIEAMNKMVELGYNMKSQYEQKPFDNKSNSSK